MAKSHESRKAETKETDDLSTEDRRLMREYIKVHAIKSLLGKQKSGKSESVMEIYGVSKGITFFIRDAGDADFPGSDLDADAEDADTDGDTSDDDEDDFLDDEDDSLDIESFLSSIQEIVHQVRERFDMNARDSRRLLEDAETSLLAEMSQAARRQIKLTLRHAKDGKKTSRKKHENAGKGQSKRKK